MSALHQLICGTRDARYLVLLPEGATALTGAAEVFPSLGVAVLDEEPRALVRDTDYLAIEPERVVYAI